MIKKISGPHNTVKMSSIKHKTAHVGAIDARKIMRCSALKPTLLAWHLSGLRNRPNPAIKILEQTLLLPHPIIERSKDDLYPMNPDQVLHASIEKTKSDISRMDETQVLDEAYSDLKNHLLMIDFFQNAHQYPTLKQLITANLNPSCPEIFYSSTLSMCSLLAHKCINGILGQCTDELTQSMLTLYRKTLVFSVALEILSEHHNFTLNIKEHMFSCFPHLRNKEIFPENYLMMMEASDIAKTVKLLKYMNDEMNITFKRVKIEELQGSKVFAAKDKDGTMIINSKSLPELELPITPKTEQRIEIVE